MPAWGIAPLSTKRPSPGKRPAAFSTMRCCESRRRDRVRSGSVCNTVPGLGSRDPRRQIQGAKLTDVVPYEQGMSQVEMHQSLVQEIEAIRVERGYNARSELVNAKYEIGRAIITSPLYSRYTKGVGELIRKVGSDVGLQWRSIYDCCRFYHVAEEAGGLEAFFTKNQIGKEMSWGGIQRLLPKNQADVAVDEVEKLSKLTAPDRANRASAGRYARRRIGQTWRDEDQQKLLKLLSVEL